MKIPGRFEGKIKALIALPVIVIALYMISKELKFTCDAAAKDIKERPAFNMIFKKSSSNNGRDVTLHGKNIADNLDIEFRDGSGWLEHIIDTLKEGDTIKKVKGE